MTETGTIDVDAATAAALHTYAAERGVSVSEIVAELLPLAVDNASIAELDRRWAQISNGASTIPHEKVESWLRTWGTPAFKPWHEK